MYEPLFSVVAPYMVARLVIPAEGLHVAVARRFVILVFAVALIGLFEFRFGYNRADTEVNGIAPKIDTMKAVCSTNRLNCVSWADDSAI